MNTRPFITFRFGAPLLTAILTVACAVPEDAPVSVFPDYAEVARRLTSFIEHEMEDKGLPAFSIALVDGQEVVWAEGFGSQTSGGDVPATAETVYRVGSVSKLFTDIGVMQLVEKGELDLDAPVGEYLVELPTESPLASATLRQLTSHRSGLIREPPVGHYFDDTEPSLEATVASFAGGRRIYPPESRVKYSNAPGTIFEII